MEDVVNRGPWSLIHGVRIGDGAKHHPREAQFPWEIVGKNRTSEHGQQGLWELWPDASHYLFFFGRWNLRSDRRMGIAWSPTPGLTSSFWALSPHTELSLSLVFLFPVLLFFSFFFPTSLLSWVNLSLIWFLTLSLGSNFDFCRSPQPSLQDPQSREGCWEGSWRYFYLHMVLALVNFPIRESVFSFYSRKQEYREVKYTSQDHTVPNC